MDKHPFWKDDGIDALSYIYDILDDFGFQYKVNKSEEIIEDDDFFYCSEQRTSWMGV